MSGPDRHVRFTPEARMDHDEMLLYSMEMWGPDQVDRYEAAVNEAIRRLRGFPELGRENGRVLPDSRSMRSGHHLIYYTFTDHEIVIHRILHERRHVTSSMLEPESST